MQGKLNHKVKAKAKDNSSEEPKIGNWDRKFLCACIRSSDACDASDINRKTMVAGKDCLLGKFNHQKLRQKLALEVGVRSSEIA